MEPECDSSDEDIEDNAYLERHAPLETEEACRFNEGALQDCRRTSFTLSDMLSSKTAREQKDLKSQLGDESNGTLATPRDLGSKRTINDEDLSHLQQLEST